MHKIVAIMPIKLNNERLPGKNILPLGKKPLMQYELDNLLEINQVDNIYVYCSDSSIKKYIPTGVNFLKRPSELDLPTSNFTQIFSRFSKEILADIYVYIHATAPFISQTTMKKCIEAVCSEEFRLKQFIAVAFMDCHKEPSQINQETICLFIRI